jgi:hypothetical protein
MPLGKFLEAQGFKVPSRGTALLAQNQNNAGAVACLCDTAGPNLCDTAGPNLWDTAGPNLFLRKLFVWMSAGSLAGYLIVQCCEQIHNLRNLEHAADEQAGEVSSGTANNRHAVTPVYCCHT